MISILCPYSLSRFGGILPLQEELDSLGASLKKNAPKEYLEASHRFVKNLRASGIMAGVPKVGDNAPPFTLPSYKGQPVSLADLRANGPVIVSFYRGRW